MSLLTVITWCSVTVCLFDIHRVQFQNGINTSMTNLTIVHSYSVVQSDRNSLYFGFFSHLQVNSRNRWARSCNTSVACHSVFRTIIGRTAIRTLACWQWINPFRRPGVNVIHAATIRCYIIVSFKVFRLSSNMYFLNYLGETRFHSEHRIDSSVASFSKSLTHSNLSVFIVSKSLISVMCFQRLCTEFDSETAHECT